MGNVIGPVIEERRGNAVGRSLSEEGERWRLRAAGVADRSERGPEGPRWVTCAEELDAWLGAHPDVEIVQVQFASGGTAEAVYDSALILYREKEETAPAPSVPEGKAICWACMGSGKVGAGTCQRCEGTGVIEPALGAEKAGS